MKTSKWKQNENQTGSRSNEIDICLRCGEKCCYVDYDKG